MQSIFDASCVNLACSLDPYRCILLVETNRRQVRRQGFPTNAGDDCSNWTLGIPIWNRCARHSYTRVGFVELGEDGHGGVLFKRRIAARELAGL